MKKYFAKIIATDNEGLRVISACCSGAKVKTSNMKYLKTNKIFFTTSQNFHNLFTRFDPLILPLLTLFLIQ